MVTDGGRGATTVGGGGMAAAVSVGTDTLTLTVCPTDGSLTTSVASETTMYVVVLALVKVVALVRVVSKVVVVPRPGTRMVISLVVTLVLTKTGPSRVRMSPGPTHCSPSGQQPPAVQ